MAIRKEFWRLAWPAAAEGLLLMLLTAADLLMVSALGNTAVAAVSIFSQPRMVILCVTRSYSVALSAYVARRRGKHPDESLTSCSRASLMLGCGLSMLLLVGTWIGAGPLLRLAGAQDDYINLGLQYAFPTLVSLALSGPAIVLHGILAGLGDTKSVLVSNVLGNGVNVVFNALLIYGLGPFPQLGVFGAGLGTAIGAGATLVYTLALFLRRRHPATLRGRGAWLPEREYLCSLAPLATGTFLEQAAERFGMFTFSRLVADLGTAALSVHNICGSLCDIYYSFSQGLGKASLVQAGQALGSGRTCNLKRIGAVSRRAALWTGGAATLLYPAPLATPRGRTARYKPLMNGIFWIETGTGEEVLAVCYPIWNCDFSETVLKQSEQTEEDVREGIDNTLGYLFFSKRASSLALFELWGQYEELRAGGLIDYPALMNYIWAHFPEYAATYNIQNQMGMHDTFGLLMNALGTEVELQNNPNKVIAMSKAAGLDFLNF